MEKLAQNEMGAIMGFYFRCGDFEEMQQGHDLIVSNPQASQVYVNLAKALGVMEHLNSDGCPDALAAMTIARLKLAAGKILPQTFFQRP